VSNRYRIVNGARFRIADVDPDDTGEYAHHDDAEPKLEEDVKRLARLQERFYVDRRHGLLVVLQGMDTCGKDGTIEHVFSGVNPQGVSVTPFKKPTADELDHPYLWRAWRGVPARGHVAIFNRSHYEDVLVVRVHGLVPPAVWKRRFDEINAFERYLADNGVIVLKFFLHISKAEQQERMRARVRDPEKQWKFNPGDLAERARWSQYMRAYQDVVRRCSAPWAPWYVIPADRKWYRNLVIADAIVRTLSGLRLRYPKPDYDPKRVRIP